MNKNTFDMLSTLEWMNLEARATSVDHFLQEAMPLLLKTTRAQQALLLQPKEGEWKQISSYKKPQELSKQTEIPFELAGDALEKEKPVANGKWLAIPYPIQRATYEKEIKQSTVLLLFCLKNFSESSTSDAVTSAKAFWLAWDTIQSRTVSTRKIRRLETILSIAQEWYQAENLPALLEQMAEASTKLLQADRASIFLWDQANKILVGRPALGIESGELRISDDTGVVGEVLRTGKPLRFQASSKDDIVNRKVDLRTGYVTKNLLCVPLTTSSGKRLGVFEILNKKQGMFSDEDVIALEELATHATLALERTQQFESIVRRHRQLVEESASGVELIGECEEIQALRSTTQRVATTELAVLLLGENGTGKDVVAKQIHYLSDRRDQPFIAINCAALSATLLESELFGHERGAFTDAHEARQGKFELASGGTLFLDEIGDMSLEGQAKLLRVLEEKTIVRVGGSVPISADVRIIAATNQDLASFVRDKKFRQDLYFRLNVVTLELPPLRDRGDDVLLLAEYFLMQFCQKMGRKTPKLSDAAKKKLLGHSWPGNIRELRNVMERLAYLSSDAIISAKELTFTLSPEQPDNSEGMYTGTLAEASQQFQIDYIQQVVKKSNGNMSKAAAHLGLHRSNLYRKIKQLEMKNGRDK